jgi:putative transposase
MPRLPRLALPGQPQHVIQRGVDRSPIFAEDADYRFYLEKLQAGALKYGCQVHAYVLMTNHVHLLVTPQTAVGLGKLVQFIGRYYVQYFNFRYRRTGTLWEGRYKATLLDSERYLLTCHRYIELNPVRAGMVANPREYPWSSHAHNALGQVDSVITHHQMYFALGHDEQARQAAYQALFETSVGEHELQEIREMTNKSWVLGNDRFRSQVEALLQRQASPKPRGGDHRSEAFRRSTNRY